MKNSKKEQKGITLIALVVTIIVLLILAGIAISMLTGDNGILNKAAEAKVRTDQTSEEERMRLAVLSALTDGQGTINISDTEGSAKGSLKKALIEEFGSTSPVVTGYTAGKVTLSNGDKFNVTTSGNEEKVTATAITFSKTGTLAMGSEVTASNGEQFYVIGGDDTVGELPNNAQTIILLAKYNLGSDGKQDATGSSNPCAFCSLTAWNGANVAEGDNLNNKTTINSETTSAVGKAIAYGESLGAEGRLVLYSEANGLRTSYSSIVYGQYDEGDHLNYWLGSAYDVDYVWFVIGGCSDLSGGYYLDDYDYGVRPVIEVSASSIQ